LKISVRLDHDLAHALESHPDYRPLAKGLSSGHADLLKRLARKQLGLDHNDPHAEQSAKLKGQKISRVSPSVSTPSAT
jgi:hypothetical protein